MGGTCRKVWHCTVMPCLDKKLESARPELSAPGAPPETDCVLTASELMQLIKERGVSLNSLAPSSLDSLSSLLSSDVVTSSGCSESSIGGGKEGMQRSLDLEVAPGIPLQHDKRSMIRIET